MEFHKHTLANGLTVVAEVDPRAQSTSVGYFVCAGARDETDDEAGVSHFLEHMVFKGTPSRTADDVNREFDEMGAHYNASTSEETTTYYASILPEYQIEAVELLGDLMRPSLREEDFQTEKQVIIEEIRMYDDQPPFGAFEKCMASHYGEHPLARSILGTVESVTDLRVEAMQDYFRRRYSPSNITLAATGRVDMPALIETVERIAGSWEPYAVGRELPPAAPHESFEHLQRASATQQYAVRLSNAPSATDEDRFVAKAMALIVGDDSGSRLYWEMVDPGLAEHASVTHYEFDGAGAFLLYMSCEPEQAEDNLRRIVSVCQKLEQEGVTDHELATAKSKIKSRIVLRNERPGGRLFRVGGSWISSSQYRSVRDDLDAIRAVTVEQVGALLAKFPLSQATTVSVGPSAEA
jgi:predicted Zn-dependent peptidase